MAVEQIISKWSAKAAADLSTKQYTLVKLGAGNTINVASAATDAAFVLIDKPKSGQYGTLALAGITKVVAGGSITAGQKLASNASGQAAVAATGNAVIGQALEDAVAGDLVTIVVNNAGIA
jgi:hypothetical protein